MPPRMLQMLRMLRFLAVWGGCAPIVDWSTASSATPASVANLCGYTSGARMSFVRNRVAREAPLFAGGHLLDEIDHPAPKLGVLDEHERFHELMPMPHRDELGHIGRGRCFAQ